MVRVAMILMNRDNAAGSIDDGNTRIKRFPNEPVIPVDTTDHKCRYLLIEQVPRKTEIVNPPPVSLVVCRTGEVAGFIAPSQAIEINRFHNLGVPAPTYHQKLGVRDTDTLERVEKIRSHDN